VRNHVFRKASGRYYFRWVVPQSLAPLWGSVREVKLSLRTTNRWDALASSPAVWIKCTQLQNNPALLSGRNLSTYLRTKVADNYYKNATLISNYGDKRFMQPTKQQLQQHDSGSPPPSFAQPRRAHQ
jgi:hypothetical protein